MGQHPPAAGIIARDERTEDDEITTAQCITVTTPRALRSTWDVTSGGARHWRGWTR